MATAEMDPQRAEEFGGRMVGVLNDAAIALMTSIGHHTGLFDAMAGMEPATSQEVAEAAGLQERYVREWLAAMTVARIVEYDPDSGRYSLPAEHAACLTRAAGPENLGAFAAYVPLLGKVEDGVVESFRNGGGVPYSAYPKFQELQGAETAAVFDATLVDSTLPMVPGLVDRLREGIAVADVGCGAGHAINVMAKAFPASRFVGLDFSEEGVGLGRAEAAEWRLTNASFEIQDIAAWDAEGDYDLITAFDMVHDQAKPAAVLTACHRALREGGTFLMVDIMGSSRLEENLDHPLGPFLYAISTMHCMTVSLAQGGEGLGTMWGEQKALEMLDEAGFRGVEVRQVEGDFVNSYYIASKG